MKTNSPKMSVALDPNSARNLNNLTTGIKQTGKAAKDTEHKMKSLGQATALAAARFAAFSIAATPLYLVSRGLAIGVKEAVSFDKQMVRVAQTIGTSVKNLGSLNKQITEISTRWGVSSAKLAEISVILAQAGMSARDTQIALAALAKTELTPSFNDIIKTTEGAIAIMNQFKVSAKDLEGVLSDINVVAKAFPVESEDIITAMQKTGGVFKTTGGNVRELIALFTAVRSTTRESADTIATGFRTIFARLERTRTQNILARLGINIRDVNNGYEAIRILSRETERLMQSGKSGQSALAIIREELGGIRQIAKVIPLLTEFEKAEEAMALMKKDNNSLDEDAIRSQDALAQQIDKTKEAFLSLSRSVVDDPWIRYFVQGTLQITTNLVKMVDALKSVIPYLLLFGAIKFGPKFGKFTKDVVSESRLKFSGGIPKMPLNTGGKVGTILTPGERVYSPKEVDTIGIHNLERMNSGIVPGIGSRDSVPVDLAPGSYVLNKRASGRIMANKGGMIGGRLALYGGGETYSDRFFAEKRRMEEEEMWKKREEQLNIERIQKEKRARKAEAKALSQTSIPVPRGLPFNLQPNPGVSNQYRPPMPRHSVRVISSRQFSGPLGGEGRTSPSIGLNDPGIISPLVAQSRSVVEARRNAKSTSTGISRLASQERSIRFPPTPPMETRATIKSIQRYQRKMAKRGGMIPLQNLSAEDLIRENVTANQKDAGIRLSTQLETEQQRNQVQKEIAAKNAQRASRRKEQALRDIRSGVMSPKAMDYLGIGEGSYESPEKPKIKGIRTFDIEGGKAKQRLKGAPVTSYRPPKYVDETLVDRSNQVTKDYINKIDAYNKRLKHGEVVQGKVQTKLQKSLATVGGGGGGGGMPPIIPGGGGGSRKPSIGQRIGAGARNPMTWMVMGSLAPQAIEGMMTDKYKKTPTGQGIVAGAGAGLTTAATFAMINPVVGIVAGLGVGLKTFIDTMKAKEEELNNTNYAKSLSEIGNLLDNESKLRKVNNKKYESDLKKALSNRAKQEQIQYNSIFSSRGQDLSTKIFEHKNANVEFGERAQSKVYAGKSLSDAEYRDLAEKNMSEKQMSNLWLAARNQAKGSVAKKKVWSQPLGSPTGQYIDKRDFEGERKYAGKYVQDMLLKFGKEKYAPGIQQSGSKERFLLDQFSKANDSLNYFTSQLNDTAQALAFARESASDFDNQLAGITGGSFKASTATLRTLQNPNLVGSSQYMSAVRSSSGGLLNNRAVQSLDLNRQISAALPGIIENVSAKSNPGDVDSIFKALSEQFKNAGPEATALIAKATEGLFNEIAGEGKGTLDAARSNEIAQNALKNQAESTRQALAKIEEERIRIEQKIIDDLSSVAQMRQKTTQAQLGASSLSYEIQSARRQRAFEQGNIASPGMGMMAANAQFANQQRTILAGTGFGGNVFSAQQLGAYQSQLRGQMSATSDPRQLVKLQDSMNRVGQSLANLKDSNVPLEAALQKLTDALNKRDQIRGVAEAYLTGSRKEQRDQIRYANMANELRQIAQTGDLTKEVFESKVSRRDREGVLSAMDSMSSLGGDFTFGMAKNELLDFTGRDMLPGERPGVAAAERNVRGIEDRRGAAGGEEARQQQEAEKKYQQAIIDSHKTISAAFAYASQNILQATNSLVGAQIEIVAPRPIEIRLIGDTAITNLEPMLKEWINQQILNGAQSLHPSNPPTINR